MRGDILETLLKTIPETHSSFMAFRQEAALLQELKVALSDYSINTIYTNYRNSSSIYCDLFNIIHRLPRTHRIAFKEQAIAHIPINVESLFIVVDLIRCNRNTRQKWRNRQLFEIRLARMNSSMQVYSISIDIVRVRWVLHVV